MLGRICVSLNESRTVFNYTERRTGSRDYVVPDDRIGAECKIRHYGVVTQIDGLDVKIGDSIVRSTEQADAYIDGAVYVVVDGRLRDGHAAVFDGYVRDSGKGGSGVADAGNELVVVLDSNRAGDIKPVQIENDVAGGDQDGLLSERRYQVTGKLISPRGRD